MPVHAINMERGDFAPLTINLCSICMWLFSCMHQLLYLMGTAPLVLLECEEFENARTGFDALH